MSINSATLKCPTCGTHNEMSARFCTNCGMAFVKNAQTPYQPPASSPETPMVSTFVYAGFWKRFVAYIIDGFIIYFLMLIVLVGGFGISMSLDNPQAAIGSVFMYGIGYFVVWWLYFALMESSSNQATLGKKLLGIKVTDMAGQPLSFIHAAGRQLAGLITSMTFYIGYLMAAFTGRKQALHDIIAGAVIVNKNFDPNQIKLCNQSPPPSMSVTGIVSVVFLVLAIPIGFLLIAIAVPAYQNYTIRAGVADAFEHAESTQPAIVKHAEDTGYWPQNFEQAKLSTGDMKTDSYYIHLESNGVLAIHFNQPKELNGDIVRLIPNLKNSGAYEWRCEGGRMEPVYLPSSCR